MSGRLRAGRSILWAALLLTGCLGLSACEDFDVGEGSAPTGVRIHYGSISEAYQTFECAAFPLSATATFEGSGTVEGDVTTRVRWSSSNPGVIDVSNGEIEAEPGTGTVFPAGTVIARSAGTALIRANYIGFSAAFSVTAEPIAALEITPALSLMTPASTQAFKLEVVFEDDDLAQDLSASAIWSLPTAGAPASLESTSTVVALSDPLNKSFVIEARLFTCDRRAERNLALAVPRELRLSYEQPPDVSLPLGFSDEIHVEAVFDDAAVAVQNLSAQVEIEQQLGDADYANLVVGEYLTLNGLLADREVQYRIAYKPLEMATLTRSYRFIDSEIQSLRVSPERGELLYPQTLELQAWGLFDDGVERPVRRDVSWESLNPELVSVSPSGPDGGEVSALGLTGDATVQASSANREGAVKAEGDVRVLVD